MRRRASLKVWALVGIAMTTLVSGCDRPAAPTIDNPPPPDSPEVSNLDPCLEGSWVMRTADLDILVTTLAPIPDSRVTTGTLYLKFAHDGQYRYGTEGYVHDVSLGQDKGIRGTFIYSMAGTYSTPEIRLPETDDVGITSRGVVNINADGAQKQVVEWVGYSGSRVETVPGGMPETIIGVSGPWKYACGEQELALFGGPGASIVMLFKRP